MLMGFAENARKVLKENRRLRTRITNRWDVDKTKYRSTHKSKGLWKFDSLKLKNANRKKLAIITIELLVVGLILGGLFYYLGIMT